MIAGMAHGFCGYKRWCLKVLGGIRRGIVYGLGPR